jgi:predicted ATPase/DNA-binding SARP family transcriptional activator
MAGSLHLRLLGPPLVLLDGQPVTELRLKKAEAILYYLAISGRPHARPVLATLVWGDMPEAQAQANLRKALSHLRAVLPDCVQAEQSTIRLDHGSGLSVDVQAFLAACARPAEQSGLAAAVELYAGELLEGFYLSDAPDYERWLEDERERLRGVYLEALERLAERQAAAGDLAQAIGSLRRVLAVERWREESHRQLMRLLASSGQRSAALAQYEACRRSLAEEMAAEPSVETLRLYERIRTGESLAPSDEPASLAAPAVARKHNLPAPLMTFLGRETELAELAERLADPESRLVTVVGPGGIGKTQLALQAARACLADFADGVYFVSLAPLGSPDFIVSAVADALQLAMPATQDPRAVLLNYLGERRLLLVLDNFEHLLAGADLVAAILQMAPGVWILATSRERLNLQGEWVIDLEGLRYPAGEPAAAGESYSAVQLFVGRARQQARSFPVADELPEILQICRLVEGMPLGLEMAATWTRSMTCRMIAEALGQNLDLLATRLRDVPERHRSMRAVFDHSWRLLTDEERTAFRRLAVFRGGWTHEAAQEVAGAGPDMLATLLEKSLVRRSTTGRYEMHELVRQYAREKLGEAGERAAMGHRHASYNLALAEAADPELRGAQQIPWLERLNAEQDNVRVALSWASTQGDLDTLLRLAGAMEWYWFVMHRLREGRRWLEQALAASEGLPPTAARAKALCAVGELTGLMGDLDTAIGWEEAASAVAREVGSPVSVARATLVTGIFSTYLGRTKTEVFPLFQESLESFRRLGERWGVGGTLRAMGEAALLHGDYDEAEKLLEEGLAIARDVGDRFNISLILQVLGTLAYQRGQYSRAQAIYAESLVHDRDFTSSQTIELAEGLALVYAAQGQAEKATRLLAAVDTLRRQQAFPIWPTRRSLFDRTIDDLATALGKDKFDTIWSAGRAGSLEGILAETLALPPAAAS